MVVKDISSQKVIFVDDQALLIDKDYTDMINTALSKIKAKVHLVPEHLILLNKFTNLNVDLNNELLILKNGIRYIPQDMLDANAQYFQLIIT